ncbi:MAG: SAM-dependent methyltransferase [Chitinophagaceae bacterium]
MNKGKLHLIPNILSEDGLQSIPFYIHELVKNISIFYVEEIKSARRFLKKIDSAIQIDDLTFYILNEHQSNDLQQFANHIKTNDIGYISEAGCPCVADPGQQLVEIAHQLQVDVVPHVGPNAILLTLMASGFNGQQFIFHGYLPNKQPFLNEKIKSLELHSRMQQFTELFIETPYRNKQLIAELLSLCHSQTKLCIACNLTAKDEWIKTKTIAEWKKVSFDFLHKKPCVFALYAG